MCTMHVPVQCRPVHGRQLQCNIQPVVLALRPVDVPGDGGNPDSLRDVRCAVRRGPGNERGVCSNRNARLHSMHEWHVQPGSRHTERLPDMRFELFIWPATPRHMQHHGNTYLRIVRHGHVPGCEFDLPAVR